MAPVAAGAEVLTKLTIAAADEFATCCLSSEAPFVIRPFGTADATTPTAHPH